MSYQENIPACCELQTEEEHANILGGCWSISAGYVNKDSDCKYCDISKNYEEVLEDE